MSMLRFSETIVAFEGVSQLEDWIHFRRRQNTFNSRIDICTSVAKSRDRISGGGRWILADIKSRDGEWPMADCLLHIGTGTCTVQYTVAARLESLTSMRQYRIWNTCGFPSSWLRVGSALSFPRRSFWLPARLTVAQFDDLTTDRNYRPASWVQCRQAIWSCILCREGLSQINIKSLTPFSGSREASNTLILHPVEYSTWCSGGILMQPQKWAEADFLL